jgi:hypothetical protein
LDGDLGHAEADGILDGIVSTYDPESGRLFAGTTRSGPRVLDFAPILKYERLTLNDVIASVLHRAEKTFEGPVEIEFAVTFAGRGLETPRFGFLQVRPMVAPNAREELVEEDLSRSRMILASDNVMGHGVIDTIRDVVYTRPESFDPGKTRAIASDIGTINRRLVLQSRPYLLIGFGRWGSSEPWLGIPVSWGHVSGARAIVEAADGKLNVEPSQGSHFFHNLSSLQIPYFTVPYKRSAGIDWDWLAQQEIESETDYVRHITVPRPLHVHVDGRSRRGYVSIPSGRREEENNP